MLRCTIFIYTPRSKSLIFGASESLKVKIPIIERMIMLKVQDSFVG